MAAWLDTELMTFTAASMTMMTVITHHCSLE
jgi:hypothetical protein